MGLLVSAAGSSGTPAGPAKALCMSRGRETSVVAAYSCGATGGKRQPVPRHPQNDVETTGTHEYPLRVRIQGEAGDFERRSVSRLGKATGRRGCRVSFPAAWPRVASCGGRWIDSQVTDREHRVEWDASFGKGRLAASKPVHKRDNPFNMESKLHRPVDRQQ